MVGISPVNLCGNIIFGLTRSVADRYNPNDKKSESRVIQFQSPRKNGFSVEIDSDEEFIFQEYGDKQVIKSAGCILVRQGK